MPEVDKEFNLRDWEWIAVHFPPSERKSMAKVAWFICCKCTPEEISQRKIDPRIVIPLCAIVLLDEIDLSHLKILKNSRENAIEYYISSLRLEQKQEDINRLISSMNPSRKWKSLFKTLDIGLQLSLVYRLLTFRPPTRDDWRNIFLDIKGVFLVAHFFVLSRSILIMLLSSMVIKVADFFLELIGNKNLVAFYLIWAAKLLFPFLGGVLFFDFTQTILQFSLSFSLRWLLSVFLYTLALIYSIKYYNLGVFFIFVIVSVIITAIIVVVLTIFQRFHVELKTSHLLAIFRLNGEMLLFYAFLTFSFSWKKTLLTSTIMLVFSSILWIYAQNLQRKVNNPLKEITDFPNIWKKHDS